jgi:PPIC-type PPIASE domain
MHRILLCFLLLLVVKFSQAQKMTIAQMKVDLEKSPNPVGYTREVLKKKYKIDTVAIMNTSHFQGLADSLAYHGKIKKVYGPYEKKYLVQVLGKAPNSFNHISQIFIDTTIFSYRVADSLANSIVSRIQSGSTNFGDMAQTYSMGGEAISKGDLGWIARGALMPEIENKLAGKKVGEVFKVWSRMGVHIVKKTAAAKEDTGFVLLMRVFL